MKASEVQSIARHAMGCTPGTWEADASGNVLCDGVVVYAAQPGVPDWQAKANGETIARLMNAKAEAVYALEQLPNLIQAVRGSTRQIASLQTAFASGQVGYIEAADQIEANRRALDYENQTRFAA
jgi:hypothetical protein